MHSPEWVLGGNSLHKRQSRFEVTGSRPQFPSQILVPQAVPATLWATLDMSRVCRQAEVPCLHRLMSESYLVKVPSIIEPLIHFLFHLVQRCHLSLVPVSVDSLLAFKPSDCQLLLLDAGRGGFLSVKRDEILCINGGGLGVNTGHSHIVEHRHGEIIVPVIDNSGSHSVELLRSSIQVWILGCRLRSGMTVHNNRKPT